MNIKEIVLKAGHSTVPAYWLSDEKPIACSTSNFERLISFAEALIAELAKAEQRVAEACALQVATETKFHWLDAARVAKEIRSGEWRKFVKEV